MDRFRAYFKPVNLGYDTPRKGREGAYPKCPQALYGVAEGMGRSFIVFKPGSALITFGMEFIVMPTVP